LGSPQHTKGRKVNIIYQNRLSLIGFVVKDGEQKFSPEDTPVTVLSVATRTSWKNKEASQWASSTEWHRIVCWSKLAKFAGSLKSGAHVQIEGEFRSRAYEKDGVYHRIWECKASRIAKLDRIERAVEISSGDETTEDQPPL
jgi:single-strand DNA-binding protein